MAYTGTQVGLTGLFYKYRTTVGTPPNPGEIRMDNVTLALVTKVYVAVVDMEGDDNEHILVDWPEPGTILVIASTTDTAIYFQFEITEVIIVTGSYVEWTVVPGKTNPAGFTNNHKMHISASIIGFQQTMRIEAGALVPSAAFKALLVGKANQALIINPAETGFLFADELETVTHDATLSGDGTVGSPLTVVGAGAKYERYEEDDTISSTTASGPTIKVSISHTFETGKIYEYTAMWEQNNSDTSGDSEVQLTIDEVVKLHQRIEPKDALNYHLGGGFGRFVGTGVPISVDIRFWNSGSGTSRIRNVRLKIKEI